ncbi:MAG: hypothetical protein AB4368_06650 [Xenococcaceae cyanobacterium]
METTLELRWFLKGTPPEIIRHWYRFECPGELLEEEPETREDIYACQNPDDLDKFRAIFPEITNREQINLKLREGNLELKLRQQKLGTQQFNNADNSVVWTGNIEQWHKLSGLEPIDSSLLSFNSTDNTDWISVFKKRIQKIEQNVKSELTWLKIDG